MGQDERYKRAKQRVEALRGFYGHVTTYVVVMVILFFIDLASGEGWWVYWPAMGWGIAIVIHAANTFVNFGFFGSGWEERKIREIMEKEQEE